MIHIFGWDNSLILISFSDHQEQDIFGMMKSWLKIRICDEVNTSILKRHAFFKTGRAGKRGKCIQLDVCMENDFCK